MDLEAMFDSHSKRKKTNSLNKIVIYENKTNANK